MYVSIDNQKMAELQFKSWYKYLGQVNRIVHSGANSLKQRHEVYEANNV